MNSLNENDRIYWRLLFAFKSGDVKRIRELNKMVFDVDRLYEVVGKGVRITFTKGLQPWK